jgi:hypothetical protein
VNPTYEHANPVTASLLSRLEDDALRAFIQAWDALEEMAVEAFRDQLQDPDRQEKHSKLRKDLFKMYPGWEAVFKEVGRSQLEGKRNLAVDPFQSLLNVSALDGLQANWELMRCFPQAREVLNLYPLERLEQEDMSDG